MPVSNAAWRWSRVRVPLRRRRPERMARGTHRSGSARGLMDLLNPRDELLVGLIAGTAAARDHDDIGAREPRPSRARPSTTRPQCRCASAQAPRRRRRLQRPAGDCAPRRGRSRPGRSIARTEGRRSARCTQRTQLQTGTTPIPCSFGQRNQRRLNRGGDRQLNHALYIIAVTGAQRDPATKEFLSRKEGEGKTSKGALRMRETTARPIGDGRKSSCLSRSRPSDWFTGTWVRPVADVSAALVPP
jgi:hypothetical protein